MSRLARFRKHTELAAGAAAMLLLQSSQEQPALTESSSTLPVQQNGKPLLIGSRMCAFAGRADWAQREFGSSANDFQRVDIPLGRERPKWLSEINPQGTVPVILDESGERVQGNSASLVKWLIKRSGDAAAAEQAMPEAAQEIVAHFDRSVLGPLYALLRCASPHGSPEWESARGRVEAGLAAVEAKLMAARGGFDSDSTGGLGREEGPFLLGSVLSLADIAVFSVLFRFQASLHEFRDYELITLQRTPLLARALEACASRPAFIAATPTPSEIVDFYRSDPVYHPNHKSEALDSWVARMLAGTQTAP